MDDDSYLEQELERLLEDELLVSTPRQRLEDARAMADGVVLDSDDGSLDRCSEDEAERMAHHMGGVHRYTETEEKGQETSTHLLQRLSRDMVDSGEWKRFHDINHDSQGALAEMNLALGSLRQWRNQRSVEPTWQCGAQNLPMTVEPLPMTQPNDSPQTANTKTSAEGVIRACNTDNLRLPAEEDPLLALWQGHHLRAQEAAKRLQKQLNFVSKPRDDVSAVSAGTDVRDKHEAMAVQGLAQEKRKSDEASDNDRVVNLRREVENLEMQQLVESVRVQASDHAVALAREACDDIRRGTQSMGEMEGDLAGFTEELDSMLLRLDLEGGERTAEDDVEGDAAGDERAPAADMHIGRAG